MTRAPTNGRQGTVEIGWEVGGEVGWEIGWETGWEVAGVEVCGRSDANICKAYSAPQLPI